MDSFEFNKIAAAVLVTILLVIGIKEVAHVIFHVEKPKQSAYKIEGVEIKANTGSVTLKKRSAAEPHNPYACICQYRCG